MTNMVAGIDINKDTATQIPRIEVSCIGLVNAVSLMITKGSVCCKQLTE